jgi:hypothetical protein
MTEKEAARTTAQAQDKGGGESTTRPNHLWQYVVSGWEPGSGQVGGKTVTGLGACLAGTAAPRAELTADSERESPGMTPEQFWYSRGRKSAERENSEAGCSGWGKCFRERRWSHQGCIATDTLQPSTGRWFMVAAHRHETRHDSTQQRPCEVRMPSFQL